MVRVLISQKQKNVVTWSKKLVSIGKKTKGVHDNFDMEFCGTFEDPMKVTFLEGTLVTNNGKEWKWYLSYSEPIKILELIKDILPDPFAK